MSDKKDATNETTIEAVIEFIRMTLIIIGISGMIGMIGMIFACINKEKLEQETQQTNPENASQPEEFQKEKFDSLLRELKDYARRDFKCALELERFATFETKKEIELIRKEKEGLQIRIANLERERDQLVSQVNQLNTQLNELNGLIKEKGFPERNNGQVGTLTYRADQQKEYSTFLGIRLQNLFSDQGKQEKDSSLSVLGKPVYTLGVPVWIGSQDYKTTYFKITNLDTGRFFIYELPAKDWQCGRIIELPPGNYRVEVAKIIHQGLTRRLLMIASEDFRVYEVPIVEIEGKKVHASLAF